MTYKNIKFDESPVMRSLERLAINKGLVKPDVISKTASIKTQSLKPTENLEENILNLCSALRTSGLTKQAVEVETKFFNLKKADSLYNINGNTGEEEVGAAHPEGSHQMKDVDGDALVETVFDTQKAIQRMIAKKPTGKLAATLSAVNMIKAAGKTNKKAEAINALKIILAGPELFVVPDLIIPTVAPTVGAGTGGIGATISGIGSTAVGGGMAGTVGAVGAAVLIGAIGGGLLGQWLFDRLYSVTDVKEAGERLLAECADVESKWGASESLHVTKFSNYFSSFLTKYDLFKKDINAKPLGSVKELHDSVYDVRQEASSIWSYAQAHKDDEILGAVRGFGDVVAASANFTKICDKIAAVIQYTLDQINTENQKKQTSITRGNEAINFEKELTNTINTLVEFRSKINTDPSIDKDDKNLAFDWINRKAKLVKSIKDEFAALTPEQQNQFSAGLLANLMKVKEGKDGFDEFRTEWIG